MTTVSGPIPLTTVTLYCRTETEQCEYFRNSALDGPKCVRVTGGERVPTERRGNYRLILTPAWCPLRTDKAVPNV